MYRIEVEIENKRDVREGKGSFNQALQAIGSIVEAEAGNVKHARIIYVPHWSIVWEQNLINQPKLSL